MNHREVRVGYQGNGYGLALDGRVVLARGELPTPRGPLRVELDGRRMDASCVVAGERRHVFLHGRAWPLSRVDPLYFSTESNNPEGGLLAPMPGTVIALLAQPGARVAKGAPLLILEAMKMEHTLTAPAAGVINGFRFGVGDQVGDGAELVDFAAEPDERRVAAEVD